MISIQILWSLDNLEDVISSTEGVKEVTSLSSVELEELLNVITKKLVLDLVLLIHCLMVVTCKNHLVTLIAEIE